jgi:L-asparaginase
MDSARAITRLPSAFLPPGIVRHTRRHGHPLNDAGICSIVSTGRPALWTSVAAATSSATAPHVAARTAPVAPPAERVAHADARSGSHTTRVLVIHTGGTLGMQPELSFEEDTGELLPGSGGVYVPALEPGQMLHSLLDQVPELAMLGADIDLQVALNCDSCRLVPSDWSTIAKSIHGNRDQYQGFIVVTGTDTMAYVASALSFMIVGLNKPVIVTGSQRPLAVPRTDARQNLVDAMSCAVAGVGVLNEVCICFGGVLLRGNRSQKTHSSAYRAFSSPTYPELAKLGVDVNFKEDLLLPRRSHYTPRFDLVSLVMRIPVVPGLDPYLAYGSIAERGIKGVVLEVFGVGNCDDRESAGWLPWLRDMRREGIQFFLTSQCEQGYLAPQNYRSGTAAIMLGAESSSLMTPEAATVKLMHVLAYPTIRLKDPIAGEL